MALDYDFFLASGATSLGFNKKITNETPEERATAQFRKEQFDSQANVGDQSLTGWWTRGQLSFHKGAGVTYYEVLEGDSVLNRFDDSEDVSVFEPGQVTLTRSRESVGVAAVDAVPAPLSGGGGVYALTATGVEYTSGSGVSSLDTSDSAVPTSITTSGSLYYVTNGTKIERQFAAAEARTNHVTNPSFETNTSGWITASLGDTHTRDTSLSRYGSASLRVDTDAEFGGAGIHAMTGLTIGQVYKVSAWVYVQPFGGDPVANNWGVSLSVADTGGGSPVIIDGTDTTFSSWVQLTGVFTATATSHDLRVASGSAGGGVGPIHPKAFYVDAVLFTESPFTSDYFDGSQPGCSWAGTANASKSLYATSTSDASVVRITSTDNTWDKVWWAKGRIWAVDASQYFYALADAVASVTNANSFWNSQREDPLWSLTDSPGPVYISDGASIYSVTVDTDGLVPTLATPTTAARVPAGETVVDLFYCLSNLIVTTTRGVRVAVVQNDQIFLGPLTIEGDFSKTVATGNFDTIAYAAGRLDGRSGDVVLCALDLGEANDDLTYPWSPVTTLTASSSTADGVVVDASGRVYAWSAADLTVGSPDEYAASGWLTTGFHRFGTLDDKHFATATVRSRGSGEIEVYRVDDDGTETLLDTLDAAAAESEVALGLSAPAERIALKFVLNRLSTDSTKGPTLLGYQLKALPVPKRQRMKRVPLMLFDREQNRVGQEMGNDGSAWTRLQALEALEEANAVVDFEDKETGETGSAYIESVEMRRTAPTSRHGDGFGGTIWLTLRVI